MRSQSLIAALCMPLVRQHAGPEAVHIYSVANSDLHYRGLLRRGVYSQIHLTAGISTNVQVGNVIFGDGFDEHTLPDAAARPIPDM